MFTPRRAPSKPQEAASPHRPSSPHSKAVLDYWKKDNTFSASVENRPAGETANESSLRRPPLHNGLPHTATCSPATPGPRRTLPDPARPQGRTPLRLGHPRLPAELEAMKQLGMTDKREILEMGIDNFNDAARASVLLHQRVGKVRHPPGALGRLRKRLQDPERRVHGVRHLGVQAPLR